ncbi:transposable element Tcb1 transposase [Trichonephila clavipes]|nr:transposable element Tcb1 transposase [Trichonephila clavipes]
MSRRKQRSAFDQVSEFVRGRTVAYRDIVDCLSGKSGAVLDETKQLYCGYVTVGCRRVRQTDAVDRIYPSASLHQSGLSTRRPLLGLPLTQNHRRLRRQWCDERRMWAAEWNEVVFADESCICLQHHDGRIRVWRHRRERMLNSCVMHHHTSPAPGIMVLEPGVLPYLQGLATAIVQQDNALPHVARIVQRFFINHQIELLAWPARSPNISLIGKMWFMVAQRLTQIILPAVTQDQI